MSFDPVDFFRNQANSTGSDSKPTQEQIQRQMLEMQNRIAAVEVEGSAGTQDYMVKVKLNGLHEALHVTIDPSLLNQEGAILEGLIAAAITDGSRKIAAAIQRELLGKLGQS